MKFISKILLKKEVEELRSKLGDYVKITADLENKWIVVGPKLHADGEVILLEKGGKQDDIWGGESILKIK